jgi:hypothetical protein
MSNCLREFRILKAYKDSKREGSEKPLRIRKKIRKIPRNRLKAPAAKLENLNVS